ncbi:hypothetical protein EON67_00365 [archaeon]|nr:MAG: hypothetical protein EON67_00365 [archaeon]
MTAAGDKFPCIATCTVGKAVEDMQQSVAWVRPDLIISLSLVRAAAHTRVGAHHRHHPFLACQSRACSPCTLVDDGAWACRTVRCTTGTLRPWMRRCVA